MSDRELAEQLRQMAISYIDNERWHEKSPNADLVFAAADRLEQLTVAREAPEDVETIRMAVVAADGCVVARWIEDDGDGTFELGELIEQNECTPICAAIAKMKLPRLKLPEIQAWVESVKP